ncbi:MAG: leucine-rich repeat protein [Clostridia bacterium]|nr:leucine-rich repeat protein [Clostridia bacterium]
MKRFCSLVLVFALVLPLAVVTTYSATGYENGFDYERINSKTEARIVAYHGLGEELVIPETLGGLPVTEVADSAIACQADTQVTTLSLPASLRVFTANAITGNTSLESITLAEGNTSFTLRDGVLYNASGSTLVLYPAKKADTEFWMPFSVKTVGTAAFYAAKNLKSIHFSDKLETVESPTQTNFAGAFENCTSLKEVSFSLSLKKIGDYAFMGCDSLEKLFIPYSLNKVKIGNGAFLNCPNLKRVDLYHNVESIGVEAFGFESRLNGAELMQTTKVEGFELCAVPGPGAEYASSCGLSFIKMRVTSNFMDDVLLIGSVNALSESVVSGPAVTSLSSATYQDVINRYFSTATGNLGWNLALSAKAGQSVPSELSESVFWSLSASSLKNKRGDCFVFALNEDGTFEYVPALVGLAPDTWGAEDYRICFGSDTLGEFFAVSHAVNPGELTGDEAVDISDLATLAQFVAGWDIQVSYLNCDVDGNAVVDISDLAALAQSIAGWDMELVGFGANV